MVLPGLGVAGWILDARTDLEFHVVSLVEGGFPAVRKSAKIESRS